MKTRYLCARSGHSSDGFEKSATKIVSNVLDHVRPGSIVIFHMHGGPNAPETANALAGIIRDLRSRGYTFVKVSDLLSLSAFKKYICAVQRIHKADLENVRIRPKASFRAWHLLLT